MTAPAVPPPSAPTMLPDALEVVEEVPRPGVGEPDERAVRAGLSGLVLG